MKNNGGELSKIAWAAFGVCWRKSTAYQTLKINFIFGEWGKIGNSLSPKLSRESSLILYMEISVMITCYAPLKFS